MNYSEFSKIEQLNNYQGIAYLQAPDNLLGGEEALNLSKQVNDLKQQDFHSLVIDLSKVVMMNSSGLGSLVSVHRTLSQKNIKLFLLNPPEKILKLFKITHLENILTIIQDISEL
jgi:anti-anti-sigma factor